MVETLAVEWGPYGIQVNGLVPGPVPARGHDRRHPGQPRPHRREGRRASPRCASGRLRELGLGGHVPRVALRPVHLRPHARGRRRQLAAPLLTNPPVVTVRDQMGKGPFESLDRRIMIVDAHVHVVARDETRFPLRPSGVGSQWFREHPVDVGGVPRHRDVGRRRPRGAGAGARRVRERQHVRARRSGRRARPLRGGRHRRARRPRRTRAPPRARRGAGVRGRAPLRDRRHRAGVVRRRRGRGAVGRRGRARPPHRRHVAHARAAAPRDDADAPPRAAGGARPLRLPRRARRPAVRRCRAAARAGRPPGPAPEGDVTRARGRAARDAAAFVELLVDRFGAERLVWGSDYPQTHDRSYAELVALGREACAGLPTADQARVLGENALRLWPSLA